MIDLDAIRARDVENNEAEWLGMDERRQALKDRRALLAYVDALAAELDAAKRNRDYWMATAQAAQEHRDGANAQLALAEAERDALLVRNEELRSANGYAELEARLAEAVRDRDSWSRLYAQEGHAKKVLLEELSIRDARLAEAEECINLASRALAGEGVEDQGEAYDKCARILGAYTPANQPRCFRCGHAQHSGGCVNTAPDQPNKKGVT